MAVNVVIPACRSFEEDGWGCESDRSSLLAASPPPLHHLFISQAHSSVYNQYLSRIHTTTQIATVKMVATRNHPSDFEEPETATATPSATSSPRKRATRTSTANHASSTKQTSPPPSPTKTRARASVTNKGWSHTPSNLSLLWLAISVPLVIWDTGYVLSRPHSMPGGSLEWLWKPYGYYGTVDHTYGFKAYNAGSGWTAAQGSVNAVETVGYFVYLYIVYMYGQQEPKQGRGAPDKSIMGQFRALSESRTVYGQYAAWAAVLGFATVSLTFWKTILFFLNEAFSGTSICV